MSSENETTHKGNILIVDDTPANLHLLNGMLKEDGYKVRPIQSGALALEAIEAEPPDLILLDITMPDMDGYEVCSRLKQRAERNRIPVIFISALTEVQEKVKAFECGGVDYVIKPFQFAEVRARVETHLTLRRLQADLERKYAELRKLQELRDNLIHMIVHDLRSPLTGISGYLQLLCLDAKNLDEDGQTYVNNALSGVKTLIEMIGSLLDVNRLEAGEMPLDKQECDLKRLAAETIVTLGGLTVNRTVTQENASEPVQANSDPEIIRRVIANLVGNALKFTPRSGTVTVSVANRNGKPRVEVRDTGPGIATQYVERVFDKFAQVAARKEQKMYSTGLGLTFCKLAVEAHGGTIGVISDVGKGSTFWFELPAGEPQGITSAA